MKTDSQPAIEPTHDEGERAFLLLSRQALLMQLDAIERRLGTSPTTAELRREAKERPKVRQVPIE